MNQLLLSLPVYLAGVLAISLLIPDGSGLLYYSGILISFSGATLGLVLVPHMPNDEKSFRVWVIQPVVVTLFLCAYVCLQLALWGFVWFVELAGLN